MWRSEIIGDWCAKFMLVWVRFGIAAKYEGDCPTDGFLDKVVSRNASLKINCTGCSA